MSEAARYAFVSAYRWWLAFDCHFLAELAGRPDMVDESWIKDVGKSYSVSRTLQSKSDYAKREFLGVILRSGQGNGMPLQERAGRITHALTKPNHDLLTAPLSFISKLSWFIWPERWTMFDSNASKAVLGRSGTGRNHFERFYVALQARGWDGVLARVREVTSSPFDKRMAERALDHFLLLAGMPLAERDRRMRQLDSFHLALPSALRSELASQGEAIAELLEDEKLLFKDTTADRDMLRDGVQQLERFKNGLDA